ncbi:MAG: nuclear transport factor 2 family protein [Rubrivivax sp.]
MSTDAPLPPSSDPRVQRIVHAFEHLTPASVPALMALYAEDARFRDPFNDLHGPAAIERVYRHMFHTLEQPRFVVLDTLVDGDRCALTWDFHFRLRRLGPRPVCIHGLSKLHLDADGHIAVHRDYWDAAEEFWERVPLIGALMRGLRRRAAAA